MAVLTPFRVIALSSIAAVIYFAYFGDVPGAGLKQRRAPVVASRMLFIMF